MKGTEPELIDEVIKELNDDTMEKLMKSEKSFRTKDLITLIKTDNNWRAIFKMILCSCYVAQRRGGPTEATLDIPARDGDVRLKFKVGLISEPSKIKH